MAIWRQRLTSLEQQVTCRIHGVALRCRSCEYGALMANADENRLTEAEQVEAHALYKKLNYYARKPTEVPCPVCGERLWCTACVPPIDAGRLSVAEQKRLAALIGKAYNSRTPSRQRKIWQGEVLWPHG